MKHIFTFLLILFLNQLITAQIPQDYFTEPLKIPLVLSGTFGELRSNHFHSGLDIKTQKRTGFDVHAAAEGYVSRIKISHYGYGKALYIQHPNGYTTVYAHLKKFSPKIEAYVKKRQYKKESYAIELFPGKNDLKLFKDEIIAYSGNSGGSGGPHLHFEIRDSASRPMNPMLFGIDIADTRKPLINTVWLYPLTKESHINGQRKPYKLILSKEEDGTLASKNIKACGQIGVGVSTYDQQNLASNRNGIYKITSKVNGSPNFEMEMKRFSFAETRYINRAIDYHYWATRKSKITKLFIEENNPLSIYDKAKGNGIINVENKLTYNIGINISDVKGNKRNLFIPIVGNESQLPETTVAQDSPHHVIPSQPFTYRNNVVTVSIPKNAVYEPVSLQIKDLPENCIQIHDDSVPLHKYMTITFPLKNHPLPKQTYVGSFKDYNRPKYVGAKINNNVLSARTRTFGKFGVFLDTIPPRVKAINFYDKKWISNHKTLRVSIADAQTGIKNYKATINGKFALMEYDYKRALLVYNFEDGISTPGENKLKVQVEDNVGNVTVYEALFYRKE